jgi:putative DNA primase/helicase
MLAFEDATPGGLQHGLATGWPSAGLFSDEGGAVIGGHGMGDETATSLLALLNILWDGRDFVPTRKTAQATELRGRRFSAFLMVQPHLLLKLVAKGARELGFIARFLVASPTSTMGHRPYRDPPAQLRHLPTFDNAITDLLSLDLPVYTGGEDRGLLMRLKPPVMGLSPAAKRLFIDFHDEVEKDLARFGELEGVRDVGAKAAENAVRLAAVCQVTEQGRPAAEVTEGYMHGGIEIARWHVNEARRLFYEVDAPEEITDARELSAWLGGRARELADADGIPLVDENGTIATRDIRRKGPNRTRDSSRLDAAVATLEEAGHVRRVSIGRQRRLALNPKLLNNK